MDVFSTAEAVVFDALGVVADVQRRPNSSARFTLIVRDGVERLGDFQQVIGRARHVVARNTDWVFRRGDEITLNGRTHAVEAVIRDDGRVNEAALYG